MNRIWAIAEPNISISDSSGCWSEFSIGKTIYGEWRYNHPIFSSEEKMDEYIEGRAFDTDIIIISLPVY